MAAILTMSHVPNTVVIGRHNRHLKSVSLPSYTVFSPSVLAAICRKLATDELGKVIDDLIDELNMRSGNADMEPEPADEEAVE